MRFADLIKLDTAKLEQELKEKQAALEALRFGVAGGGEKQVHRLAATRREIAQIKTALYSKRSV